MNDRSREDAIYEWIIALRDALQDDTRNTDTT